VQIGANGSKRMLFSVLMTKGSPNYTFRVQSCVDGGAAVDLTKEAFLNQAILDPITIAAGYDTGADQTLACDESAGALNAINLAWDRNTPRITVHQLAIVQFT
jgi:hypothetical protein